MLAISLSFLLCSLVSPDEIVDVQNPPMAHRDWIRSMVAELPMGPPLNRKNLEAILNQTSNEFLELKNEKAWASALLAESLITAHSPYPSMREDLIEVVALQAVIAEELNDEKRSVDCSTFANESTFLDRLPFRMQAKLKERKTKSFEIPKVISAAKPVKIWLNGLTISLNKEVGAGDHLIHWLDSKGQLAAARWKTGTQMKVLWSRNLWADLSDATIQRLAIRTSIPTSVSKIRISQSLGGDRIISLMPARQRELAPAVVENPPDPFWKQTWFWVVAGAVVAGAGAYAIYETQQTKVIRTP